METSITHKEAIKAAMLLKSYCKERFNKDLGERGCKECIFSAGEPRRKRCILTVYLENVTGVVEAAEKEVNKNYERLCKQVTK